MKYELIATNISAERPVFEGEKETDKYQCTITLGLHPIDNIAPNFSKDLTSVSDNSQTGFEVDKQRKEEIESYLKEINV